MEEQIYDLLSISLEDITEISKKQRKALQDVFGFNLNTYAVSYANDKLILTSTDTYKNWMYYAALEYVDIEHKSVIELNAHNIFLYVFDIESERIEYILELLKENE